MTDTTSSPVPPHKRPRPHCALCGKEAREPTLYGAVRPVIAKLMSDEHPELVPDDVLCGHHVSDFRTRYVADLLERERGELSELDRQVVASMAREETVARDVEAAWGDRRTVGEKVADVVADFGGSWTFIGAFFAVIALWMAFNIWVATRAVFDPYPFILLNLVLSCLAAIQAPIIMMSQNRQADIDRGRAIEDFEVNTKAELEIVTLHEKIDLLREQEIARLTTTVDKLVAMMEKRV
jgi:uncharacterized membrane protein